MQTRPSRRASTRQSGPTTPSSRRSSKRSERNWESRLRRAFFADAADMALSMGVCADACVDHVRTVTRGAPLSAVAVDALCASVVDVVIAVACTQASHAAWSELRLANTWRLREAIATHTRFDDGGLRLECFWRDLHADTMRGDGLHRYEPRLPLCQWIAHEFHRSLQRAHAGPTCRSCRAWPHAGALGALDGVLDSMGEGRTLRFPVIAAVR